MSPLMLYWLSSCWDLHKPGKSGSDFDALIVTAWKNSKLDKIMMV